MEACRLCLLSGTDCMNIFSDSALRENVVEIISQHVGEVVESDPLPNHLCMECWTKIFDFHEFHNSIRTAQARYLNDLVKYEDEINNFVDVLEPDHLNIGDAYVDQQIDVLDTVNDEQNEVKIKIEHETFKSIFIETSKQLTHDESMGTMEADQFKVSDNDSDFTDANIEYSGNQKLSINKSSRHKKEFICDICSKAFATKQIILRHLLRHVENLCPICPKRYLNPNALNCHIRTDHSKDKFEELKNQLEILKRNKGAFELPDSEKIEAILVKHYDAACDICSEHLPPSLKQIKSHYVQEHAMNGYLKCCDGIKLKSIDQIHEHVRFHLHPEIHKCAFCDSRFVRGNVLKSFHLIEKHIKKHLAYDQRKAHMCFVCRTRFASIKLLNVHQKYYHGFENSNSNDSNTAAEHRKHSLADFFTMRCDLCDDVKFSTFHDARQHYQNTHEMRGYLVCCDRKFMKPKTVDDHFQWHINPEYLKCHYCGKCFDKKLVLATHISRHKAIETKRFSCPNCNKAFKSNHCLKKHIIVHHEETKKAKNVPCPHCKNRYATERSLLGHIRYAHTRDKDGKGVICEICGKTFVSQSTVQTHIRIVHCTKSELDDRKDPSKRQQCTMCDASFINKYRLKKHVNTVHMAEPVKCKLCDKIAPNPPALVCHMKSVHVEQNFQCHLCAKAFKAAAALKDHIATHTGEKLYKCSFCSEAFIWRPNMYSHQKKAHPEEWKSKKSILK